MPKQIRTVKIGVSDGKIINQHSLPHTFCLPAIKQVTRTRNRRRVQLYKIIDLIPDSLDIFTLSKFAARVFMPAAGKYI